MTDSTASGSPSVVGRDVGQALDLAHDVVAEVADDAAVERRQLGDARRAVVPRAAPRARRARPGRSGRRAAACPSNSTALPAHDQRERGIAAEEREPAPALGVLDRLEQERRRVAGRRATSFTNAETGVSRSASTSRHTGTTVWSRASATNSSRDGSSAAIGAGSDGPGRGAAAEGPEEAAALAGVAGAPALLLDHEEQRRRRRSRSSASRTYWRSPEVSPLHQYSWRLRLQNHVRPVSSVRRSASSFIQPSMSTSPVPSSWTIAATRPSALYVHGGELGLGGRDRA